MNKYIGVKAVQAMPMTRGDYNDFRGWTIPENENPLDQGYLIEYKDGYKSWCPKKQFEEANRAVDHLTFGHALELIKTGERVTRKSWKNIHLQLGPVVGDPARPFMYFRTDDGRHMEIPYQYPWADVMADDWLIVEENPLKG